MLLNNTIELESGVFFQKLEGSVKLGWVGGLCQEIAKDLNIADTSSLVSNILSGLSVLNLDAMIENE